MTNLPISGEFSITATFGQTGKYWANGHKGVDIVCGNRDIYATCDATVRVIGYDSGGWGRYVTMIDANGDIHIFCHMVDESVLVTKGQKVNRKTKIGIMGTTGNSSGIHLHYQINRNGQPINPCDHLGIPNQKGTYNSANYTIIVASKEEEDMTFKDGANIAAWAKGAVDRVSDAGIMLGDKDEMFRPKANLTREEAAVMIDRLLEKLK